MTAIFASQARLPDCWGADVRIEFQEGAIATISEGDCARPGDTCVDTLLPAPGNLHSHSFQRAMAGMTEVRSAGRDSFWTWRDLMYRFLHHLTPEQYEAIAALVFMEMLEAGYAAVGEFHYVHHQADGARYGQISELSQRVFAAAAETGIGLTHLPVLYTYGGAGKVELSGGQRRFDNSVDQFCDLVGEARSIAATTLPTDAHVGIAPHSLRATAPDELDEVLRIKGGSPVHIHIAEQPKEVADISAWLGARPVEWLLANAPVDASWCLIHATHMTSAETRNMAKSGAVAGLCPITEANLADGPFNGPEFLAAGGAYGIGSDSNVRIALGEELRLLEYSQRLRDLSRNVMITGEGSVGAALYFGAAQGAAQALGRNAGGISEGNLADLIAIDGQSTALCALKGDQILDGLVFGAGAEVVSDVWSAGRHMVRGGRHIAREAIIARYKRAIAALMEMA